MLDFLEKFKDGAYTMLRIGSGFMFAMHGVQKMFGWLTIRPTPEFGTQMWIGGLLELVGGVMIMIGVKTREAAFICSGMMAVAYTQFHWKFELGEKFFPIVNKGEMAALYALLFLYIATQGAGKWVIKK